MLAQFSIVVAYAISNRGIGLRGGLPWPRLSADMTRFSALTRPHALIMGRTTFCASLNGQPLPGRRNVVLSSDSGWAPPAGAVRAAHWVEALHLAHGAFGARGYDDGAGMMTSALGTGFQLIDEVEHNNSNENENENENEEREVFVIGGGQVYHQALNMPLCKYVHATEVEGEWNADTFFPILDENEWRKLQHPKQCPRGWASDKTFCSDEGDVKFHFVTYERR